MSDPTIPPQLCDDKTTHEAHTWLDSDKGNPANHTWWCPGLHYDPGALANPDLDDPSWLVASDIHNEFKERILVRIQTMSEDLNRAVQEANRLLAKIHKLDDDLAALRMELGDE